MNTGIVRRIDELGRIVIPREIRRTLNLREGASLEIAVENDKIILQRFSSLQGNASAALHAAEKALMCFHSFVIYDDTNAQVCEKGRYPLDMPAHWQGKNETFYDEDNCLHVFPIIAHSSVVGYIGASSRSANMPSFVEGVIAMIQAEMEEG